MTFVMLKAQPGKRWRTLFEDDSEGARELPLGEPPHSVSEVQVDGFKPVNHHRVAGRKESASEWHEITINVPIPEAAERKHVHASMDGTKLAVTVTGWMVWERRLQQRILDWEDKHVSSTHVDMQNSTWLITHDEEKGHKVVQFVLSQWMEGANKNQESEIRRQLKEDRSKVLLEDADPLHMYDLVEAEMFLRAGAVFKPRSKVREKAMQLIEEMEKIEEREGRDKEDLRHSPFADAWADDEDTGNRETQLVVAEDVGGEVEEAAAWWAEAEAEERENWCEDLTEQNEIEAERRAMFAHANADREARAAAAQADEYERREKDQALRRKEQAFANRQVGAATVSPPCHRRAATPCNHRVTTASQVALALAAKMETEGAELEGGVIDATPMEKSMGVSQAREAAAAAARANPLAPRKLEAETPESERVGAGGAAKAAAGVDAGGGGGAAASGAPPPTASLAKCGYYIEDLDGIVKVTLPLEAACAGGPLPKEGAVSVVFGEISLRVEALLGGTLHVLDVGELQHRIVPERSTYKLRLKTKKCIIELHKLEEKTAWKKLSQA